MKTRIILLITLLSFLGNAQTNKSFYNIKITEISGETIDLNMFRGKKILFVNVASQCGFTKQYSGLQKLHNDYKDKLVVIGVPCNQFGAQEPGTLSEIKTFCQANFGVEFLMTEKINVKGENQHELYKWLTSKEKNGVKSSSVKWNFQKYLLDEEGKLLDVFYSETKPNSEKIIKYLN
ncbi:glutathione peroxidase [Pseudofulvibacter geojedonensis]|uniref:Glutathione peroxidase n=1 Tax=Pseudofulvibacter geojedonensis TaxID=1123758 RepID=A0ABW3I2M1_9FLAO